MSRGPKSLKYTTYPAKNWPKIAKSIYVNLPKISGRYKNFFKIYSKKIDGGGPFGPPPIANRVKKVSLLNTY